MRLLQSGDFSELEEKYLTATPRQTVTQQRVQASTASVTQGSSVSQAILDQIFDNGSVGEAKSKKEKATDCVKNGNGVNICSGYEVIGDVSIDKYK